MRSSSFSIPLILAKACFVSMVCLAGAGRSATAIDGETGLAAFSGKHIDIDKSKQELRAYEGSHLVLVTHISTGKYDGSTPNGLFEAGDKYVMHYSRLFHHAPMPYSVQVSGNVFIHGFTEVPGYPASHGCIRVPVDHENPARILFNWVERGTPIKIFGHWFAPPVHSARKR